MSPRRTRRLLASAAAVLSSAAMMIAEPALAAPAAPAGPPVRGGAPAVKVLPADNAPSAPGPTAPAVTAGALTLTVDAMAPEILHSGEDLRISGTITNGTTTNLSGASIIVQAQQTTEVSTRSLGSWLAGERSTSLVTVMEDALDFDVAPGASQRFSMTVKSSDLPLSDTDQWGPRGIQVTLAQSGSTLAQDRAISLWDSGASVDPSRVTVVIPVTASPAELALLADLGTTKQRQAEQAAEDAARATSTPAAGPTATDSASPDPEASTSAEPSASATPAPSATASPSTSAGLDSIPTVASPGSGPSIRALRQRVTGMLDLAGNGVVLAIDPALIDALGMTPERLQAAAAAGSGGSGPPPAPVPSASADPSGSPSPTAFPSAAPQDMAEEDLTRLAGSLYRALTGSGAKGKGDVVVLPWGDADVSALTHLGATELMTTATTRASGSLLAGASASTSLAWPAGPLDAQTLSALPETASVVVASPGDMSVTEPLTYTPSGIASRNDRTVLLPDTALSAGIAGSLETQASTQSLSEIDIRQYLRAQTAILTRQAPNLGRDAVIAIDRRTASTTSPTVLGARVDALRQTSWTTPAALADLSADADQQASRNDEPGRAALPDIQVADTELSDPELSQARATAQRVSATSSVLHDPAAIMGTRAQVVSSVSASAWRSDTAGRTALITDAAAAANSVVSALQVAPTSTINLISDEAELPIRVSSSLAQDSTVVVEVISGSPRLQTKETVSVVVPAGGQAVASVPVSAVGSGNARLTARILAPDGTEVGTPASLRMRVRADWEGRGTRIVTGALVILLAAGIYRTVRRGRRAVPDAPHAGAPEPEGDA
ncbi:DUF6049 family protein [Actinomyces gaoshouyii]|uniref:Conjugal transfer protein n=1 Tax=Actinomyces gaoshouyii TaxID=1960083 RepID=A0A8H9H7A6_9ACTO|nr:DUF6049 family protein [Actinomyces gaoshouyii]GGO95071.1 hypothetical protein GCM10011612_02030 [Actinomyces gaoshouyii]